MKFFVSLLVVFLMIGFVAAPAVACDHNCGDCPNSGDCGHDHNDDCERCDSDCDGGHDQDPVPDNDGDCQGDSCPI